MLQSDTERNMDIGLGIVGIIAFIHFVGLLVIWVVALSTNYIPVTQAAAMSGYWVLNAAFSIFTGVFVGEILSIKALWAKIIAYPIGIILLLLVLVGLAAPAAFVGVLIGVCCGGS